MKLIKKVVASDDGLEIRRSKVMYEKPNIEVIYFKKYVDVITASSLNTPSTGDSDGWIDGGGLD